jgi:hypothetical protein
MYVDVDEADHKDSSWQLSIDCEKQNSWIPDVNPIPWAVSLYSEDVRRNMMG